MSQDTPDTAPYKRRMAVAHVEVRTNAATRDSRLFDSMFGYIKRSSATIVRIYASYEPLKVFSYIGGAFLAWPPSGTSSLSLRLLVVARPVGELNEAEPP